MGTLDATYTLAPTGVEVTGPAMFTIEGGGGGLGRLPLTRLAIRLFGESRSMFTPRHRWALN